MPAFAASPRQSSGRSGYGCDNSFFSLAYPGKDPGSASVHLKTCLLPEASLDAGSFTGWGAWLADVIMKTSIARCLRKTGGDSPCCTDTSADIPAGPPTKVFGREGRGEGEPFSKKVSLSASFSLFTSSGACLPSPKQKNPRRSGDKKRPPRAESCKGVSNNLWQRPTFPHDVMQYHRRWRA